MKANRAEMDDDRVDGQGKLKPSEQAESKWGTMKANRAEMDVDRVNGQGQ